MFVIAGLGNPGNKYEGTRHNIGFEMIDYVARTYGININKLGFKALYGQGMIEGEKVILVKPQTFMNLSGQSIKPLLDYYKIPEENFIVIYDDVSLPLGKLRMRTKGSAGGHNGIKDIIYMLNTDVFPRIKVGVGMPENPNIDMADHVLGYLSKEDFDILLPCAKRIVKVLPEYMKNGAEKAINLCNSSITGM